MHHSLMKSPQRVGDVQRVGLLPCCRTTRGKERWALGELTMADRVMKERDRPKIVLPAGARDHMQGPRDATVTLLEYADFECAHCAAAFPTVKEVTRWLRGALCYVFRHFPASDKHPNALGAAEAAEAAAAQGRFWEM